MDEQLSVLYFSATGGTEKVVKGIAEGISDNFKEYNITSPNNRLEEVGFESNELVIIGVPVYAGRVPGFLKDYLLKVKGKNTPAIFITVYGNRNYDDALLELQEIIENNGFVGIAAGAFVGEHSNTPIVGANRPDAADLETAKKFGLAIRNKLERTKGIFQLHKLVVKGNFPYKERPSIPPMAPDTNDDCVSCGICAKHCPMGAINFNDFKDIDSLKCVCCCSCIKRCPVKAKEINHEVFNKITKGLIDNFSTIRHEPECFL